MSDRGLKAFLRRLEKDGELQRVKAPVDPRLEVTEIVTRVVREQGPALLFEKVNGSDIPLVMNVFGTEDRMARALEAPSLDAAADRIRQLVNPAVPAGFAALGDALSRLRYLRHVPPKKVREAPCQAVVLQGDDVDLDLLPGVHAWPEDGGKFLNIGITHTQHPETGLRNVGMYRLQQHDKRTLGLHWQIHKDSTAHHAVAERRGERLPVAIAFGPEPALTYAASAPLPNGIDEYMFAGMLQQARVEQVDCVSVPLQVPANSQVVLEGWLEPGRRLPEGPFGDHTGFYTPVEPFPALTIDTITMQQRPVFPSIVVGRPPQEDGPIGLATERLFLPLLQMVLPEIVDYHLPSTGVFHNCCIVSIDKRYPKHAQKVMNGIWGVPHLLWLSKVIVVVDADCDVHDYTDVAWRAFGNVDFGHDLLTTEGPVDHLDHASYDQFWGVKVGLDATAKLPQEGYRRDGGWPRMITQDPAVVDLVTRRWKEYGLKGLTGRHLNSGSIQRG
jgi:4-hydroxy-3-polyprenylbenzoate decarboxylase